MIDWSNERYVRVYTRDTAEWLSLSFEAQSLFLLVLRKVDRSGVLPLGKLGRRAVAVAVGHGARWSDLDGPLAELETDGCVVITGDNLTVPNYLEAQESRMSDAQRKRESRARRRETALGVTIRPADVTPCPANVTRGHTESHAVTPSLAVPSRAEPSRAQSEIDTREGGDSTSALGARPPLPPSHGIPDWQSILSRESKGRIDPNGGSASLMVGMREAIAISGYTRADLEALGRLAATGALERLVRGKGTRRTVTLPDLHGFNGDWAPLTDAIVEARERARKATQPTTASTPADPPQKLLTPEQIAAGARAFREQREAEKREKLRAEAAARVPREGES